MLPFLITAGIYVFSLILVCHLLLSRKPHTSLILWSLWLLLNPVLGIPLYLVLGTDTIHRRRFRDFKTIRFGDEKHPESEKSPSLLEHLARVKRNRISEMSAPELLWGGLAYYKRLIEDLDQAKSFIHLQVYVWRDDDEGREVMAAVCRAARRGVTVRVIVDEMGSFYTKKEFFTALKDAGASFAWTSTVRTRFLRFFFNLRNHRKIIIVDGLAGYVGGMNIGKEYAGKAIGPWTDLQMRFTGPVLHLLQDSFAEDWQFATLETLEDKSYYPDPSEPEFPVVVVSSGPDELDPSYLKSFNLICNSAQKTLDLFTPYFVPNENILITIQTATARGVRVRLLIPTLNEHMYMVDIGRAYYEPLLESGVEIYELPGRVHHSKVFRVDEDWIFAGSHNLDVRSYKLNFELSLCFQSWETAEKMDQEFAKLFEHANRMDQNTFKNRPLFTKIKQGFIRLFGPVL
jgi:cardiolipin synthase